MVQCLGFIQGLGPKTNEMGEMGPYKWPKINRFHSGETTIPGEMPHFLWGEIKQYKFMEIWQTNVKK